MGEQVPHMKKWSIDRQELCWIHGLYTLIILKWWYLANIKEYLKISSFLKERAILRYIPIFGHPCQKWCFTSGKIGFNHYITIVCLCLCHHSDIMIYDIYSSPGFGLGGMIGGRDCTRHQAQWIKTLFCGPLNLDDYESGWSRFRMMKILGG